MVKVMRVFHHLGIVLFLGSIAVFVSISVLAEKRSLTDLVFAREIIKTGSFDITLTGLVMLFISGVALLLMKYRTPGHFWLSAKKVITVIIVLNTFIFVLPAVNSVLGFAKDSLAQKVITESYKSAYLKESIAGGVNVILTMACIIISFWRKGEE
jgi:hypothetical protein